MICVKGTSLTLLLGGLILTSCSTASGVRVRFLTPTREISVGVVNEAIWLSRSDSLVLVDGGVIRMLGDGCRFDPPVGAASSYVFLAQDCELTRKDGEVCVSRTTFLGYDSDNQISIEGCVKLAPEPEINEPLFTAWGGHIVSDTLCTAERNGFRLCAPLTGRLRVYSEKSIWNRTTGPWRIESENEPLAD